MLDAHPLMAIPPETHFIPSLDTGVDLDGFFSIITSATTWADFHIDKDVFNNALNELNHFSVTEGLRCFYRLYGDKYGEKYVGDKIPPLYFKDGLYPMCIAGSSMYSCD
jgi:hypothetical protein